MSLFAENDNRKFIEKFRPHDIASLAYILLELFIVLIFMYGKPGWIYMTMFYISSGSIVLLIVAFPNSGSSGWWRAVRIGYPMLLYVFFYKAIGPQVFIIFDKPFDSLIHGLEQSVFGADPAFMMQNSMEIWLNEVMNFGYFSYYLQLPAAVSIFLVLKKWDSLEKIMLSSALTFYICYVIFIFFPVTGPRFYLQDIYYLPIIGPLFTPLAQKIVNSGGHFGAAMPSSHCAIALVVAWRISRDVRKLTVPAYALMTLLCVSTIYGRFHYLTDVVVGLIIGALGTWIAGAWFERFSAGESIRLEKTVSDVKNNCRRVAVDDS